MPATANASPMSSSTVTTAGKPASVNELMEDAKVMVTPQKYPWDRWLSSASTMVQRGKDYERNGDIDNAFIYYQRFVRVVLEILPAHPKFTASDVTYQLLNKDALGALSRISELTQTVDNRLRMWERQNQSAASTVSHPKITTPTSKFNPFRSNSDPISQQSQPNAIPDPFAGSSPTTTFPTVHLASDPFAPTVQSNGETNAMGDSTPSISTFTSVTNPQSEPSSHYNPFLQDMQRSSTTGGKLQPVSFSRTASDPFLPSLLQTPPTTPDNSALKRFLTTPAQPSGPIKPVGLRNLGNTCYMNATLQCLSLTMPLSSYFARDCFVKHLNVRNSRGSRGVVAMEFAKLMKSMSAGNGEVVVPKDFKKTIGDLSDRFYGNQQHDSSEFLTFLLDMIHEDLNVAPDANSSSPVHGDDMDEGGLSEEDLAKRNWERYVRKNYSIVVDLFQGQLKSRLTCLTCGKSSNTFSPFMYLSVPIPTGSKVDITDCVRAFIAPERMEADNAWFCPRCKTRRDTIKETFVVRFPSILIVHLKRFGGSLGETKIRTDVEYPILGLDLGFCKGTDGGGVARWRSIIFMEFCGTLTSGHYTARMRHGRDWYYFDDAVVNPCARESLKSEHAYALFYARHGTDVNSMTATNWWS
ncbi:hypothetical protein BC829DRAFT_449264 [Chytridium lagenaria]|nr:hypothetical protein BC829DRAFT_449264 [Chytridium lagenaria]